MGKYPAKVYKTVLVATDPSVIDLDDIDDPKEHGDIATRISEFTTSLDDADHGDVDDCVLLPAAAERLFGKSQKEREAEREADVPEFKRKIHAEIDKIMNTKATTWDGAILRNRAIRDLKEADPYPENRPAVESDPDLWCRPPDYRPEPATGFAVAAKPRRVSLAAQASGTRLVAIAHQIEQTKDDRRLVGRLLAEAKLILGHGRFVPWVKANLSMALRTAQAIMNECNAPWARAA
jgi:hypothetical protein